METNNTYQRWFISNAYTVNGRPKMEAALMTYAREAWLHCSIYGFDLLDMVDVLGRVQGKLQMEHRQWAPVKVILTVDDGTEVRWLKIGAQHLTLQKIREELEYVELNAKCLPR